MEMKRFLVTGGCGFLGSNISARLISEGMDVIVFDNLYRFGSAENLNWLKTKGDFKFLHRDIRNREDVEQAIRDTKPDVVFHLAGQVAMTTSVERPQFDFDINVLGSFNLLEAVRKYAPEAIVIYSSTNKVYGDLDQFNYEEKETRYVCSDFPTGFSEAVNLNFSSPYGCSKGAADQYLLDYHKMFGLKTIVFRHSSIFGGRQFSTFDQGWIGWFMLQAVKQSKDKDYPEFTVSGNGKQVRDLLFIDDAINCYLDAYKSYDSTVGNAYNIGGGIENSLSILELFQYLESRLDTKLNYKIIDKRASDQKVFVADISKIESDTSWQPRIQKEEGLDLMLSWITEMEENSDTK